MMMMMIIIRKENYHYGGRPTRMNLDDIDHFSMQLRKNNYGMMLPAHHHTITGIFHSPQEIVGQLALR